MTLSLLFLSMSLVNPFNNEIAQKKLGQYFNVDRVAPIFEGKAVRAARHETGFTSGERPSFKLTKHLVPSQQWVQEFKAALSNLENYNLGFYNPAKAKFDLSVRFVAGRNKCDVFFSSATGEIMIWSDFEGKSLEQSVRPGLKTFAALQERLFPKSTTRSGDQELPPLAARIPLPAENIEKLRLRRAGIWAPFSQIQNAPFSTGVSATVKVVSNRQAAAVIQPKQDWNQRFLSVLENRDSIDWNNGTLCVFNPDVEVSLNERSRKVTIQFCFTCDDLILESGNSKSKSRLHMLGGRPEFLTLFRELIPQTNPLSKLLLVTDP